MTTLKTLLLMALFLILAAVIVFAIFRLLELATRADYVVRPGIYVEVPR